MEMNGEQQLDAGIGFAYLWDKFLEVGLLDQKMLDLVWKKWN